MKGNFEMGLKKRCSCPTFTIGPNVGKHSHFRGRRNTVTFSPTRNPISLSSKTFDRWPFPACLRERLVFRGEVVRRDGVC